MASTNKTTNYELSQYIGTDKPTYLSDYNGDMLKIDTAMKANADNISTAVSSIESVTVVANQANATANTASTNASNAVSTANSASTTAGNAQSTANSALSTATTAQSTANTNSASIGDLSTLDTFTKTDLVSAINEVVEAENIAVGTEHETDRMWHNKNIYTYGIETTNAQAVTPGALVDKTINVSSLNIEEMVDMRIKVETNVFCAFYNIFGGNNPEDNTRCYYDKVNKNIVIRNGNVGYNSATITIIIEYTKSA